MTFRPSDLIPPPPDGPPEVVEQLMDDLTEAARATSEKRLADLQRRARLRRNNMPNYPDLDEGAFDAWLAVNDPGDYVVDLGRVVRTAVEELDSVHAQASDGIGCVECYPSDGRWPCVTAMIADDLRFALEA